MEGERERGMEEGVGREERERKLLIPQSCN